MSFVWRSLLFTFFIAFVSVFTSAHTAVASELVGYWAFNESSGNAADSSGNLSSLTNSNVTYGEGKYGNAAYFNGSTSFFSGTGPNLNGQSFTFSAWLWREAGGGQEIYFSQGSGDGSHNNLHLRVYDDGLMRFGFLNNDLDAPAGTFTMGQWNHVVLTYDATTNARKIYLNGGEAKASDTSVSDFIGNTDLNIGRWIRNGGDQYWTGRIDDLKIYNRALTLDEVDDIAEGGAGPGLLGIDTLSPADNATGVSLTTNLVATFSTTTVATSTGSIGIYKTDDDSLVESISVTGAQLTKSGADITINPSVTLDNSTEYYVWIPSTAFKDADDVFYEGTTASTTWSFTTVADEIDPVISAIATSSVTSTGATVTWTTDEAASTKVVYSADLNYASTTAETDTSPRVTSHSQSLTDLLACTIYNFRVVSADAAGNYATSSAASSFTTTGCSGGAIPTTATSTVVTVSSAATTTITDGNNTITVSTPEDFTATSSSIVIQIKGLSAETVLDSIGTPNSLSSGASVVFDVKALIDNITELDSFDVPVTISYTYDDSEISGLDESTLSMYHYADNAWSELDDCSVNTATNTITCTAPHFSIFGIFGSAPAAASSSGGGYSGTTLDGQIRNLLAAGKPLEAWKLTTQYPARMQHYLALHLEVLQAVLAELLATPAVAKEESVRDLELGMEGDDVRDLQTLLITEGHTIAAGATGYFGSQTQTALAAYQSAHGVSPALGYFGPTTRQHMETADILGLWW